MLVGYHILVCRAPNFIIPLFSYIYQNNLLQPLWLSVKAVQQENLSKNDGETSLFTENLKKIEQQVYIWFILH